MLFSSPAWDSVVYWALDLETGGLDPRTDAILAVGMLPLREGTIRVGEAYATLVRPESGESVSPASITAHQLVWGEVRAAPPLEQVVPEIAARLREGVLLVHHRALDLRFLQRAFRRVGNFHSKCWANSERAHHFSEVVVLRSLCLLRKTPSKVTPGRLRSDAAVRLRCRQALRLYGRSPRAITPGSAVEIDRTLVSPHFRSCRIR